MGGASAGRRARSARPMRTATEKSSAKKSPAKKSPVKKSSVKQPTTRNKRGSAARNSPPAPTSGTGLIAVGAKAPDFTLPNAAGKLVTLSAFKGKPVVLYFYPKDDTPGCTQEACDFRDNLAAFRKLGCTVLGVSPDSVKSHAEFASKYALTITLLADEPAADGTPPVCAQFGVWQEKSMYGRAYMGVVRTTFVIARDGTVAQRYDKVSVPDHVGSVLEAVRALK